MNIEIIESKVSRRMLGAVVVNEFEKGIYIGSGHVWRHDLGMHNNTNISQTFHKKINL